MNRLQAIRSELASNDSNGPGQSSTNDWKLDLKERINRERESISCEIRKAGEEQQSPQQAEKLLRIAEQLKALESDPEKYFAERDLRDTYEQYLSGRQAFGVGENEDLMLLVYSSMQESERGIELLLRDLSDPNIGTSTRVSIIDSLRGVELAVEPLIHLLGDKSFAVQKAAVQALAGEPRASRHLLELLDSKLWREVIPALAGVTEAEPKLIELLQDEDRGLIARSAAAKALKGSRAATTALVEAISDQWSLANEAASSLRGHVGASEALTQLLESERMEVRDSAAIALAGDLNATEALLSRLLDPKERFNVRQAAAHSLLGNENATQALSNALEQGNTRTRILAASALKGNSKAVPALLNCLSNTPIEHWELRKEILKSLTQTEQGKAVLLQMIGTKEGRKLEAVRTYVESSEEAEKAFLEELAGQFGQSSASLTRSHQPNPLETKALIKTLKNPHGLREQAAEALTGVHAAGPALLTALQDQEPAVQVSAARALKGIPAAHEALLELLFKQDSFSNPVGALRKAAADSLSEVPELGTLLAREISRRCGN